MPFAITDYDKIYAVGETEIEAWRANAERNDTTIHSKPRTLLPATKILCGVFALAGTHTRWGVLGNGTLCHETEVGNVD